MKNKLLLSLIIIILLTVSTTLVMAQQPEQVTICHGAGQEGTTHFVTLTLSWNAVYGQGGHFYENGTTRAGHEQDYLGACNVTETPTVTPSQTPSQTPAITTEAAEDTPTPIITTEVPENTPTVIGTIPIDIRTFIVPTKISTLPRPCEGCGTKEELKLIPQTGKDFRPFWLQWIDFIKYKILELKG